MITVVVPRRKEVPRLKKLYGAWVVLYIPNHHEFIEGYRLNVYKLQQFADELNRKEQMHNLPQRNPKRP